MSTFFLFYILQWLLGSFVGRLVLLAGVLWYLDNRYVGLLAALWVPIAQGRRIGWLKHSVEVNPSDVHAMVELGEHYLNSGRAALAAEHLERAMARGEDSPRAIFLMGAAQVRLQRYAEGRARLAEALAKVPTVAFGEPYLYLLEEALATEGPDSPRVAELVSALDEFDSVEVLTRAGRLLGAAGRRDLGRRLLEEAVRNYAFTPKALRRRARRWVARARWTLLQMR